MANGQPLLKEKDKPKKLKKKTVSKLKKELDKVFSLYIRQIYSRNGTVQCYTCSKVMPWQESQCGHFASRVYLATRYDERNCRPQCVGCNVFGNGQTAKFADRLEEENQGIVAELYREATKVVKDYPYEVKIEEYKEKLKNL